LIKAISKREPIGEITSSNLRSLRGGKATGTLIGGNMSLIMSTIGTAYDIDTDGKILFLEDIGEDIEVIDNYLMHLKLAGKLKRIKGIVFGRMIDCIDNSGKKHTIEDILNDILDDIEVPILYGFPSGHRVKSEINITLPFGVSATIDGDNAKLIINEAGVS
ncbi:LD-carboxypeptidase, partial [bacterium]|nr:LD-carboxypeptidase [bacterium]